MSRDECDYIIYLCVVERLLIILYGRRANMCGDGRARPNRAIASIEAEAYRDNMPTKRKKDHVLVVIDQLQSSIIISLIIFLIDIIAVWSDVSQIGSFIQNL